MRYYQMGSNFATDLADYDLGLDLSTALEIHLTSNHYPPIPKTMVLPCIEALEAYWDDETDREIPMPEGVSYRGQNTAPAWAIIEQHHLEAWL
jgi:hypothetical protein